MVSVKPSKPFNKELENVLSYALTEFGATTVKRFNKEYSNISRRLSAHPLSSPKEPLLRKFQRPYRSATIRKNWKIIYRYDKNYDRAVLVDLWDMRRILKHSLDNLRRNYKTKEDASQILF